ncbi:MAG TPA: RNA polymerase sigma factor [Polyangiaceae bacterium]|nr:RNA polymerase sigma factor [Polyangiaceae bacterium]
MVPARSKPGAPHLRALPSPEGGPQAELSDERIISAVVRGDSSVADTLYDRCANVIDQTLYRVLGRRESDHEDLVQQSFEQVVKTLSTKRFAGACSLRTWASSIASNVALNALRSRRRERKVFDRHAVDADAPSDDNPERDVAARGAFERLRYELSQMSPGRAEALLLHDVLGHDLAEIAAMTDTTVAAAQSRLVRGRHELRKRMRAGGESDE